MTKKSYAITNKYLLQAVANIRKYQLHGRRAGLTLGSTKSGVHADGSKALMAFFKKHKQEIEACCKSDNKDLNDEDELIVNQILPEMTGNLVPSFFGNSVAPPLPFPLPLLSEKECIQYLSPLIRKDLAVNKGLVVHRINWGDPKHEPRCWDNRLRPWHTVSNPAHPQLVKHDVPMVDALKGSIRNQLILEHLDPETHIDPQMDQKLLKMKQRARGFKISQPEQPCEPRVIQLEVTVPAVTPTFPVRTCIRAGAGKSWA